VWGELFTGHFRDRFCLFKYFEPEVRIHLIITLIWLAVTLFEVIINCPGEKE